jgi:ankyrin repeat protein
VSTCLPYSQPSTVYLLAQDNGADVTDRDGSGNTAFLNAILLGSKAVVECLVVRGAANRDVSECVKERTKDTERLSAMYIRPLMFYHVS